jgi:hypothetical protein
LLSGGGSGRGTRKPRGAVAVWLIAERRRQRDTGTQRGAVGELRGARLIAEKQSREAEAAGHRESKRHRHQCTEKRRAVNCRRDTRQRDTGTPRRGGTLRGAAGHKEAELQHRGAQRDTERRGSVNLLGGAGSGQRDTARRGAARHREAGHREAQSVNREARRRGKTPRGRTQRGAVGEPRGAVRQDTERPDTKRRARPDTERRSRRTARRGAARHREVGQRGAVGEPRGAARQDTERRGAANCWISEPTSRW